MVTQTDAVIAGFKAVRTLTGSAITYTRPSTAETVSITAVPGESVKQIERDGEVIDEIHSRDFLVLASELKLAGVEVTPKRFDTITEGATVFSVLAVDNEPHFRYTDHHRTVLRIHTKRK